MDLLANENTLSDSLRLTIPRACRFIYEIASNRGARHDADEVAANEMDANAVTALCSWVLAEMVSHSQRGMDLAEAKAAVDGLMKRKYPFMEQINGRVYVDIANSAREAALLILYGIFPKRMSEEACLMQFEQRSISDQAWTELADAVEKWKCEALSVLEALGSCQRPAASADAPGSQAECDRTEASP
jgi:hypothetical protein